MIHKVINRLSLTFQQLSGDKPFTIKLVNAYVELLRNTKSRQLRNRVIKKHIKKTTNISQIKEVFIENSNTLIKQTEFPKFIWTMWWQGEENAPELVQSTLYYIRKFAETNGYTTIVIDKNNIDKYLVVPKFVYSKLEKGSLGVANFSDLVRFMLMEQYGGIWLDSTMYVHQEFPIEILEREFSSINHNDNSNQSMDDNITNKRWVSFCLSGEKGNIVSRAMRAFLLDQIKNNKVLPDYFIIDFGLDYLYDEFEEIKQIIKSIPRYSSQEDIFWLRIHSRDSYDKAEWHDETKKNQIFKSSYKEDETVKDSYFDYLVKRKL